MNLWFIHARSSYIFCLSEFSFCSFHNHLCSYCGRLHSIELLSVKKCLPIVRSMQFVCSIFDWENKMHFFFPIIYDMRTHSSPKKKRFVAMNETKYFQIWRQIANLMRNVASLLPFGFLFNFFFLLTFLFLSLA